MDFETLLEMVNSDAALRRRRRLQPAGGPGDKIFPSTYPGTEKDRPRHAFERRFINGEEVWCVVVDSVQSQANRLEEALLRAAREEGLTIPYIVVDFRDCEGLEGVTEVTSLDAPHRVYDAILRDSSLDGEPFMSSELGRRLAAASPENATAILEVSPNALLFGAWHSTGTGGGLGAKFARCLVSEIVAIRVPVDHVRGVEGWVEVQTAGRRTGSRIDPLGILKSVEVYKSETGWDVTPAGAGPKAKKVAPSNVNHGNIAPTITPLGVTCDYVEHSFVVSFAALRRLRFGGEAKDLHGRALLAALGLLALAEQDRQGYALRSRCDLVPEGPAPLECVHADGTVDTIEFDLDAARELYNKAVEAAIQAGFRLKGDPVRLVPQDKLVAIVRESQRLALEGKGGEAAEQE